MSVRIMRILRTKYGISIRELANAVQVSTQYFSGVELGAYTATDNVKKLVATAFERLIAAQRKRTAGLAEDYAGCREQLLDFVEVSDG